ncbi:hypothetical protein ACFWUP_05185 [Nocardia sp. NPDC058658]|uniref:hypothetical protein n=1 Tax=Nocardia sp. NPDC058658 TaxID=3346580 RepID=UPI00365E39C3
MSRPLIVTDHALHRYPTLETFPEVPATQEHNSFIRYRTLTDFYQRDTDPVPDSNRMGVQFTDPVEWSLTAD